MKFVWNNFLSVHRKLILLGYYLYKSFTLTSFQFRSLGSAICYLTCPKLLTFERKQTHFSSQKSWLEQTNSSQVITIKTNWNNTPKLLIVFIQLLYSRRLLEFSVDHLWLLSPGSGWSAAFKLLTAIQHKNFWNFQLINASPPNVFHTISDCCCLAGLHTQQDSFAGNEGTHRAHCANTFEASDSEEGIKCLNN